MTNKGVSKYIKQRNIKNTLTKILETTINIIFYPLRLIYKKYDGSKLQKNRLARKAHRKLMRNIYKHLIWDDIYITDFWVHEEHRLPNVISIHQEGWSLRYYSGKSFKELFNEIEDVLMKDEDLIVESVNIEDVFKYGYSKYLEKHGRVLKVCVSCK